MDYDDINRAIIIIIIIIIIIMIIMIIKIIVKKCFTAIFIMLQYFSNTETKLIGCKFSRASF